MQTYEQWEEAELERLEDLGLIHTRGTDAADVLALLRARLEVAMLERKIHG